MTQQDSPKNSDTPRNGQKSSNSGWLTIAISNSGWLTIAIIILMIVLSLIVMASILYWFWLEKESNRIAFSGVIFTYIMLFTALVWIFSGAADFQKSDPDEMLRQRLKAVLGILVMATVLAIALLVVHLLYSSSNNQSNTNPAKISMPSVQVNLEFKLPNIPVQVQETVKPKMAGESGESTNTPSQTPPPGDSQGSSEPGQKHE